MTTSQELLQQSISRVLSPGSLQRITACDGHFAAKIHAGPTRDPRVLEELASRAARAAYAGARAASDSFIQIAIEFVDATGAVVHASRYQAAQLAGAPMPGAAPHAPPAPTASAPGDGHKPIPGLADRAPTSAPTGSTSLLPDVKHIIAVGAGKGGVGKSTIAINLAVGLARQGHAVGLLDGDIYGPSFPTMLGLAPLEQAVVAGKLQPFLVHGVKAITIGKLVDADKPLIWRGPMAHGAFKQLTEQTHWGELDYLIIDLPPGTGDVSLTMAQTLRLTGAIVVCTPQRVAQDDAVRAARMFQQLKIEVLGVVENMSYFLADDLSPPREYDLFGRGGAEQMAKRLGVPFLGAVPITIALRENSDAGNPSKNFDHTAGSTPTLAAAFERLVQRVESQAGLAAIRQGQSKPTLTIA